MNGSLASKDRSNFGKEEKSTKAGATFSGGRGIEAEKEKDHISTDKSGSRIDDIAEMGERDGSSLNPVVRNMEMKKQN